jgi:hypothetical protein
MPSPTRIARAWEARADWLQTIADRLSSRRPIAVELARDSELLGGYREAICAAGKPLLERAVQAGQARPDVAFEDVFQLSSGEATLQFKQPEQLHRVVDLALDGVRGWPPEPERSGAKAEAERIS